MKIALPIAEAPRPRVVTSEPMKKYRCNQKGCCCRGWDIPFKLDDFIRLFEHLPEGERDELGAGLRLIVDEAPEGAREDLLLRSLKLAGVGEDKRCRFCTSEGGCEVHAKHGISALPDICVNFPAQGFHDAETGNVELYWDSICPEVVRLFAAGDGPLALGEIAENDAPEGEMGWQDPGFAQRVSNARATLTPRLGEVRLHANEFAHVRTETMRAMGNLQQATWENLAGALEAYRGLKPGQVLDFAVRAPTDPDAFQAYLAKCIGVHGGPILLWSMRKMERFVFAIELKPLLEDPHSLLAGFDAWGDALDRFYFSSEEALRPLFARYLQHRFGMLYVNQEGELREGADTVGLLFGLVLRYSAALAFALSRPVDSNIAQAAIAAAEYFYRSLQFPPEALPWFASR